MSILANISCNISKTVKKTRTGQRSSVAVQFSTVCVRTAEVAPWQEHLWHQYEDLS